MREEGDDPKVVCPRRLKREFNPRAGEEISRKKNSGLTIKGDGGSYQCKSGGAGIKKVVCLNSGRESTAQEAVLKEGGEKGRNSKMDP